MPPGAPALHRGLARPSALNSRLSCTFCPSLQPCLRPSLVRPYTAPSSHRGQLHAAPVASIENVRQELENARKGDTNVLSPNVDMFAASHAESKNFLARLASWTPLFTRLQNSSNAFLTFRHEADVCNRLFAPGSADTRLVDQPQYLQSIHLWLEILRFRLRVDGQPGVMDVVEAVVDRRVVLPLRGPQADQVWSILLWAAVQSPQILRRLYPYLVDTLPRSGLLDIRLYHRLVGPMLRQNPMFALSWHKRMRNDALVPSDFVPLLASFAQDVCLSNHKSRAIEAYKKIYTSAKVKHAYDECMLQVCRLFDFPDAVDMHNFFLRHDDHPSLSMQSLPSIIHLNDNSWLVKPGINPRTKARLAGQIMAAQHEFQSLRPAGPDTPRDTGIPAFTRASMSTLVGDVHNIREKELNDAFCARLFATTAFSTDLIITGLRMLGLKAVGNLALREIAARVPAPPDYITVVDAIKAAGISVVESVFSRALQSFASQPEKHQSFEFLVTSDQHPATYEDRSLQKRLFSSFLASGDHSQANAVLDVLTIDEPNPENYHANLILQAYARRGRKASTLQILHEMRLHRIPVSESSLRTIQWNSLRPRLRAKRPITQQNHKYRDDLDFTTNVFLETMRTGQSFNPTRWHEILKRYGMQNRLDALDRLSTWLASWYSGRLSEDNKSSLAIQPKDQGLGKDQSPLQDTSVRHPLSVIFTEHLLRAIVAWGFKSEMSSPEPVITSELTLLASSDAERSEVDAEATDDGKDWTRGLKLIRKLEYLGVDLRGKELRREVKLRLWILYGPGRSTVPSNRQAQQNNKLSLVHRVRRIHRIMGMNWLRLPEEVRDQPNVSDWAMYGALFSQPRRRRRRQGDRG